MMVKRVFHIGYYIGTMAVLMFGLQHVLINLLIDGDIRTFAFTIDTIYLHWNTSFPAVTVCEVFNGEKNWDLSERFYGNDRNNKLDDFISDITFFNGKCYACGLCEKDLVCPSNFSDLLGKFRTPCHEMLNNCNWNNQEINCCDAFLPLQTEFGLCYAINSIHTKPQYGRELVTNRVSGPGILQFIAFEDIQIHVHSSNDVPYAIDGDIKETVLYGSIKEIILSITEMMNDPYVQDISINNRKCRFSWELTSSQGKHQYEYYSHSTCTVECAINVQIKYCNCSHHLMPSNGAIRVCDIKGLSCLTDHFAAINKERRNCECLASCEEPEYNTLYSSSNELFREEPGSLITISMIDLPKQRYVRHVVRTDLDHVISVGGICSLFFGISILSALDSLYKVLKTIWAILFVSEAKSNEGSK